MSVFQKGLYVVALGAVLSGCASSGNTQAPVDETASDQDQASTQNVSEAGCSTGKLETLIGKPLTPETRQVIVDDSGATSYRMLRPDTVVTQEYDPERLNILIDDEATISRFSCG